VFETDRVFLRVSDSEIVSVVVAVLLGEFV